MTDRQYERGRLGVADVFTVLGAVAVVDRFLLAARDNREVALRHVRESPAVEPR